MVPLSRRSTPTGKIIAPKVRKADKVSQLSARASRVTSELRRARSRVAALHEQAQKVGVPWRLCPRGGTVTATLGVQSVKAHRGYPHEALMYSGSQGFLDAVVPFIRDGLERDQPILVAVVKPRIDAPAARAR